MVRGLEHMSERRIRARWLLLGLSTVACLGVTCVLSFLGPEKSEKAADFSLTCFDSAVLTQTLITVTLRDDGILPASLHASTKAPLHLRVVNQGGQPHNLVIPDFYIFTNNLNPKESIDVSFTPDKAGVFPFYSDTGGNPEPGLQGSLHVSKN